MEQGRRGRPRAGEEKLTSRHHRCRPAPDDDVRAPRHRRRRAVNFLPSLSDSGGLEELQAGG
jgi:hypothetical protein